MNKKQKSSIILASLATIAVSGSLIAGATYALFTSESTTNIAVTSGKVDVKATISDLQTYSGVNLVGNTSDTIEATTVNGTFTNGGTANINETTGDLELVNVTPGDKVTFKINVKNNSNVAIKYRTIISCDEDDGLFGGLEFTIGGNAFDGLLNKSDWEALGAEGAISNATLNCSVILPSDAGNKYQGKACKVSYTVEAVQGNAATSNPVENVIEIDNAAQLGVFRDKVNSYIVKNDKGEFYDNGGQLTYFGGKTVKLTNDIDLDGENWAPIIWTNSSANFTFDGNDKTISNFVSERYDDINKATGFFAYAAGATIKNLKIDKATINGVNHSGAVVGSALCTKIENCHVSNSTITSSYLNNDDGDKAGAIVGYLSAEPGAHVSDSSATNCTVKGYRDIGGLVGYLNTNTGSTNETAYVTGNSAKDITIINDRTNNYKKYTTDTQYDVHEVVGEQAILEGKTKPLSLVDSNTVTNVTTKIILADGFTKVSESKYEISNTNGFDYWASSINNDKKSYANATIKLTANIDYSGRDFTPINLHQNGVSHSNMVFDGGNFTISNINIKRTVVGYGLGIFSDVASSTTIQNVTFDKIVVDSRSATGEVLYNVIGIVMGYSYSKTTFNNVKVTNSEVYGYGKVGILVGMSADPGNSLFFKDVTLSNNTICGEYNMGCLIGLYERNQTTNKEYVTIDNVSITDITVKSNRVYANFREPIELNAKITCEEGKASTCLGYDESISGQYTYYNGCYWGFYAEYYVSYGASSHDCAAVYNGTSIKIANSEKIVNSSNHTNPTN